MNISIAMCTYNGAQFLGDQLRSIAAQTFLPDEVVICDDNSTDGTVSVATQFARDAPFEVRLYRNETNLGSSANFAQALAKCRGELIALSDQDDIWYPQKLAALRGHMSDPCVGGVFSDGDILTTELRPTGLSLWKSYAFFTKEQKHFQSGAVANELFRRNVVTGMTMMFRSCLRSKLLPVPHPWVHDGWFAFMIELYSKLVMCPERLVGYRRHRGQQIGPPLELNSRVKRVKEAGPKAFLEAAKKRNVHEYRKTAAQFAELAKYLGAASADVSVPRYWIEQALKKKSFCNTIATALTDNGRFSRLKTLLSQSQQYSDYTLAGRRAMVRDSLL